MSGCKSIVLLETGAGSASLISRPRLNLSVKIHLERKSIIHGGRIPELPELLREGRAAAGSGPGFAPFSLDSGRMGSVA